MKKISLLFLIFILAPSGAVIAQESSGPQVDFGFEFEPVWIEERNVVVVSVSDEFGNPLSGFEDTIALKLEAGKTIKEFELEEGLRLGTYSADIVPTADGEWIARISGTIDGSRVFAEFSCADGDFACPKHRTDIGFPGDAVESQKLWARLAELEVGVANATASDPMAFLGIIAGVLGLLAGGAALMRRRDI